MVIGFKTTIVDAGEAGARQAPVRFVIASSPERPLLLYPIAGAAARQSPEAKANETKTDAERE